MRRCIVFFHDNVYVYDNLQLNELFEEESQNGSARPEFCLRRKTTTNWLSLTASITNAYLYSA